MPRNAKNRRKEIQKSRNLASKKEVARLNRHWPGTRRTDLGMAPALLSMLQGLRLLSGRWKS